ncbi:MAG: hypothetical protein KF760_14145 [Candidatus Eremiobacteraeota bacterium]|nr:hypothetical protein [Candidatus Eremiobacteraeota bacterium]MCW5870731.1 hypothetical protein [Candidatus Eremiobacteraeota bacterium]
METETYLESLTQQVQQWEAWEKHSKQQGKLWRELSELIQKADLVKANKLLNQLQSVQNPPAPSGEAAAAVKSWCETEERQRPLKFGKQLREAAEAAGVAFQQLGASPPTVRLEPFTVELDFKKGEAEISFSRLELATVPLDCDQILRERARLLASLESADFEPAEYLGRVFEAYRRTLAAQNLKWGERVDLVEVLPELAFLQQSERFRKDPVREAFKPYGKVRFAYDLARLRRARQLEHQGARLTLGTATLGSTRHKDRVLFLEEAGQGQYYLSIAFQGGSTR